MIKSSHTLRTGEGRPIRPDRILKTLTAILNSRTDTLKRRPLLPILNIKTGEKKWQRHQFGHTAPTPTSTVS